MLGGGTQRRDSRNRVATCFDSKPNFLQRDSSMIVLSKHGDARLLQGAEETPSTPGVVVIALPIVLAIPNRLISQNLIHSLQP
jgi:hypothetical protein